MFVARSFCVAISIGLGSMGIAAAFAKKPQAVAERVWITRPDGSLQCDPKLDAEAVDPIKKAEAQLKSAGITVFESKKTNDGAMHASACGIATGNETSFLIDRSAAPKATALGFRAQ